MIIPATKLKAILLYFCENTNKKFLGKTKLLKLFYFADFAHVKRFGIPITFDDYYHLEHGPIPTIIKNLIDTLSENPECSILSDTILIEKTDGQNIQKITPIRKYNKEDENLFSNSELKILQEVCARFGDKNTKFIEKASHEESPWKKTEELQRIPYYLSSDDADCLIPKDELMLMEKMYFNCKP
jgi:uncharacterized phage-associated protein